MKKKIGGVLLLVLAASFVAAGVQKGGSTLWGGLIFAAASVLFALRLLGVLSGKAAKKQTAAMPIQKQRERTVWIAADGSAYHNSDICQYIYGKKARLVYRSEALSKGLKPCKKCYPYGD